MKGGRMMTENRNYYVYGYIRLDTNTYFYIGKGTGDRYCYLRERSKHFTNIVNNRETTVEILYDNLTEAEALMYEEQTISQLVFEEGYSIEIEGYNEPSDEFLVNRTWGGDGISGYKFTEEQRRNCSRPGKQNGMYGKKGELCPFYGVKFTDDHKDKLVESSPHRKTIYCKELNREFRSYREAERILEEEYGIICHHGSISSVARGRNKKAGYYKDSKEPANLHFYTIE